MRATNCFSVIYGLPVHQEVAEPVGSVDGVCA